MKSLNFSRIISLSPSPPASLCIQSAPPLKSDARLRKQPRSATPYSNEKTKKINLKEDVKNGVY